jgi:hypothetical protein
MRPVALTVGGTPVGESKTWPYPKGDHHDYYLIPVYEMTVEGTDNGGKAAKETIKVLRFGVQSEDGKTAKIVGLAEKQTHVIKARDPTYPVHSASSGENGGWQVFDNYLIHDGPDGPDDEVFATIGCIEIMGLQGFTKFNDLLIRLVNPPGANRSQKLAAIGGSRMMTITYLPAVRPSLKKAP